MRIVIQSRQTVVCVHSYINWRIIYRRCFIFPTTGDSHTLRIEVRINRGALPTFNYIIM